MFSRFQLYPRAYMCVYGRYPPMLKSCGLYPFHGALQVPTLMGVLASVCTPSAPLPTRKQQLPTSSAQQCWEFLRPFARTYKKKLPVDVTSDLAKADWERVTRVSVRSFLVLQIVQLGRNLIFPSKASPKQLHRKLEALFCDRRVKEPRRVKS